MEEKVEAMVWCVANPSSNHCDAHAYLQLPNLGLKFTPFYYSLKVHVSISACRIQSIILIIYLLSNAHK
jgi:hypothetical protein